MSDEELKDLIASLAVSQAKTGAQIQELKNAQLKTDAQMAKTDAKLDKVGKMLGGISNNQGDVTEEYFVNSLKNRLKLGDINFDFLVKNFKAQTAKKILAEYDILLVNGNSVAIVEVKQKVHLNDLAKLPEKIESLKNLPQYDNYEVYAGVAGFFVPDEVIKQAQERGYFVLQRKGDVVVTYSKNLKVA